VLANSSQGTFTNKVNLERKKKQLTKIKNALKFIPLFFLWEIHIPIPAGVNCEDIIGPWECVS